LRELTEAVGAEAAGEALESFVRSWPTMLADLNVQVERGEFITLHRGAHTLKGLAATFGLDELRRCAESLEDAASEEHRTECQVLVRELARMGDMLTPYLRHQVASLKPVSW
jgi:HPt (histidine-containing phosphotransfer) domain-containing protein